ncbi:MFS transporter [Kitasatospora sp. RG8]|uniref:MFS transporter n=1 Tax=Kitasatospora sp. RG8 TaxID=2820815 RepID=UPI001ADEF1EC|nr:MFS transporter [Kitasatospora sp. RG8]MBP0451898.1 MFS transporter [Kitasatospora sp. RG8]
MNADTQRADRKAWIGLAVLVLPVLLVSLDMHVLSYALPMISSSLEPSSSELLWIIDIYPFMLAGLLLTMGTLGDRIGRRKLLMFGAVAFGTASALGAYSSSAEMLILTRALLGVGGATLMPSTLSLIRNMFHNAEQRRTAIAVWTGAFAGGAMLGPLMGGAILEKFWWGAVFLVNLPVMAVLVVLAPLMLPESKDSNPGKFDFTSSFLSLAALLPTIYGVQHMAGEGVSALPIATIVIGLTVGYVFLRRQRMLAEPMLDTKLFRSRAFTASIAANTLGVFSMVGSSLFTTQYLQMVAGVRPFVAGLYALPAAGAAMTAASLAPLLVRKVRPAFVVGIGLLIGAVGFTILGQVDGGTGIAALVAGTAGMAGGITLVLTISSDMIISTAPPEKAGTVSGLSQIATEFGGALGISILGSVGTAVYRADLADNAPEGVAPATLASARDTLGTALDVTTRMPKDLGEALADAARTSFTHGLQTAMFTAAGLLVLMALLAFTLLRKVTIPTKSDEPAATEAPVQHEPEPQPVHAFQGAQNPYGYDTYGTSQDRSAGYGASKETDYFGGQDRTGQYGAPSTYGAGDSYGTGDSYGATDLSRARHRRGGEENPFERR